MSLFERLLSHKTIIFFQANMIYCASFFFIKNPTFMSDESDYLYIFIINDWSDISAWLQLP